MKNMVNEVAKLLTIALTCYLSLCHPFPFPLPLPTLTLPLPLPRPLLLLLSSLALLFYMSTLLKELVILL